MDRQFLWLGVSLNAIWCSKLVKCFFVIRLRICCRYQCAQIVRDWELAFIEYFYCVGTVCIRLPACCWAMVAIDLKCILLIKLNDAWLVNVSPQIPQSILQSVWTALRRKWQVFESERLASADPGLTVWHRRAPVSKLWAIINNGLAGPPDQCHWLT